MELAALDVCLRNAIAGKPSFTLLIGVPGVGKTCTALEFAGAAKTAGSLVLWASCMADPPGFPGAPWGSVAGACARHLGSAASVLAPDPSGTIRAPIPTTPREQPTAVPKTPEQSGPEAAFDLLGGLRRMLTSLARRGPVVLILDDLQCARSWSLHALEQLLRRPPARQLCIVGLARPGGAESTGSLRTLARLADWSRGQQLRLLPFSDREVEQYIRLAAGTETTGSLVSSLHRHTEGNPLFLAECVALITARPSSRPDRRQPAPRTELPPTSAAAIDRRLSRLSKACREILDVASVIGNVFSQDLLEALSHPMLPALQEAVAAEVIRCDPDIERRYWFDRPLVRETIYDALPARRRRDLHLAIAAILELSPARQHLSFEMAHHLRLALPHGGAKGAIQWARLAGDQAASMLAFEEAADLYRFALDTAAAEGRSDPARCPYVASLGNAHEPATNARSTPAERNATGIGDLFERADDAGLVAPPAVATAPTPARVIAPRTAAQQGWPPVGCADRPVHPRARNETSTSFAPGKTGVAAPETYRLLHHGDYWTVSQNGDSIHLKDGRGLRYICRLLQQPEQEFHALDLVRGEARFLLEWNGRARPEVSAADWNYGKAHAGLEILDERARAAYGRRLAALREQLHEAESCCDVGRIPELRAEIDFLAAELAAALGLHGGSRLAADDAERARVAVTKRIKEAISHIESGMPPIGRYLRRTIKTGLFCSYAPDPDRPVSWNLR